MAKGLLVAGLDFTRLDEGEFHDWYDTEHVPERERCPGFINAQRWINLDNPRLSVATYDLDEVGILKQPGYLAIGYENLSPWSKRIVPRCGRVLRFEGEQINPGGAIAPKSGFEALLLFAMNVVPAFEAEFNNWYDQEHLPGIAAVPGVLSARRFRATDSTSQRYLALYHLTAPEVASCPQWAKAVETPWTLKVRPQTSDRLRLLCRRYQRKS